ncbi:NEW3 domain-containing protein [Patulibacter defluvii]|uniref:NEW3 domain-containing protein n=1 Tax=Patulibacter defluvii TaxID=3095358 RepID=UPI002A761DF8|nr:NEW3 domain-containing protein [Patulibacter sp. DM4]
MGGVALGALASAASASAATAPIAISFTSGTSTPGTLPALTTASAAAPATFAGQIDSATLRASFPAASIALPPATRSGVDFGAAGTGDLTVAYTPSDFTGTVNAATASLDLTGTIGYLYSARIGGATYACTTSSPVTLSGGPLNLTTGAYSVAGSHANLLLTPVDAGSTVFCLTGLGPKLTAQQTAAAFAGTLTIPGLIPAPAVPPPTTPTTPTTPTPGTPPPPPLVPAPTVKAPKLRLTLAALAPVARGGQTTLTIRLRNPGNARARGVRVVIAPPAGVRAAKTTLRFSSLPRGRTRTLKVRLRATDRARPSSRVRVTATAEGGLRVRGSRVLRVR